jgi:hypothetical protein
VSRISHAPKVLLLFWLCFGAAVAQGQPKRPVGIVVWDTAKLTVQALSPAAFGNPAKALCWPGNLRVLREAAYRPRGRLVTMSEAKEEKPMATKTKRRPVILEPVNPPDSFDRQEMRRAIRELAEARRRKKKRPVPAHDGK